jgi:hypothetical protein
MPALMALPWDLWRLSNRRLEQAEHILYAAAEGRSEARSEAFMQQAALWIG